MRWTEINPLLRLCIDPSAQGATARKHKRVQAVPVEHREFKIANGALYTGHHSIAHLCSVASAGTLIQVMEQAVADLRT
jgi:hypothetical protein